MLLVPATIRCKDEPMTQMPPPTGSNTAAICAKNPELIAEKRACIDTSHCPCGTHCELGECVATCLEDAECGDGQRCDELGRCRAADDTDIVPEVSLAPSGDFILEPAAIALASTDSDRPVWLTPTARDLGAIRVAASEGLQIACDGASFGSECRLPNLALGERLEVRVRATTPLEDGEVRTVRAFSGNGFASISVSNDTSAIPIAAGATEIRGAYTGYATLAGVGAGSELSDVLPLELPITGSVFADANGDGVVVIDDDLAVLHPDGKWIGRMSGGVLELPAYLLPLGAAIYEAPSEVLAVARPATVLIHAERVSTLTFTLEIEHHGISPIAAPVVAYRVHLARSGDLPADATAPDVPASATPSFSIDRALVRTAWEAAFPITPGAFRAIDMHSGGPARLDACGLSANARAQLGALGFPDSLRGFARQSDSATLYAQQTRDTIINDPSPEVVAFARPIAQALPTGPHTFQFVIVALTPTDIPASYHATGTPQDELVTGAIPCTVDFSGTVGTMAAALASGSDLATCNAALGLPRQVTIPAHTVDSCDELAAQYECDVLEVDDAAQMRLVYPIGVDSNGALPGVGNRAYYSYTNQPGYCYVDPMSGAQMTGTIRRVCRLRSNPDRCGEAALCNEDAQVVQPVPVLGASIVEPTGDLTCESGSRSFTLALDRRAPEVRAADMLEACIADLDRLAAAPDGTTLPELFSEGDCLGGGRLLLALGYASENMRQVAFGPATAPSNRELALVHRILQRWIQIHTFIAREASQAERLAPVIRRVDPNDPDVPPPSGQVLAASVRGWDLLLHPRFGAPLLALPGDVLQSPDYRPYVTGAIPDPMRHHEQSIGISVAMLDALSAQAALAEMRVRRAGFRPDADALRLASDLLRRTPVIRAIAAELHRRAETAAAGAPLSWASDWERANQAVEANMRRLIEATAALERGENPLGIEETDLPLYFFGDEPSAGRRFSAISDYLLGTGPGSVVNWAPSAVRNADDALQAARDSWVAFKDRELARQLSRAELDLRTEQLAFEFGDKVGEFCSAPNSIGTAEIMTKWAEAHGRPFSAENCFIKLDDPRCEVDLTAYARLLDLDDVQYQLCVASEVRERTSLDLDFLNGPLGLWLAHQDECIDDNVEIFVPCSDGSQACARCTWSGGVIEIDLRSTPTLAGITDVPMPPAVLQEARNICAARWPNASQKLPSLDQVLSPAYDQGECYRGSLGEQALTLRAIAKDLEIARSEMAELQETYDINMRSCIILKVGNNEIENAIANHNKTMTALRGAKLAADIVANMAASTKDCANSYISDTKSFGVASGVACGAAFVEGAAKSVSDGLQFAMDEAQAEHDARITELGNEIAEAQCFNDAELALVGSRTAALRVQRAAQDLEIALYQFNEMKISANTYYADGIAALSLLADRHVVPPAHDFWLDEALRRYERRFSFAQRVVYLAVRAVEYEYQQSLAVRGAVLQAEIPDDLEAILQELWTTAGTRTIGGRPEDLTAVVSMRDHLLQLADKRDAAEGELPLSDVDRFRLLLTDPRHAVYGPNGAYLGQRIPFRLAPLEKLGLGETAGVPLFAGNDCAERLWSVSANLIGGEEMYQGAAPSIRIELMKSNTFYSQWCDARGRDTDVQIASVRPSRNLLRGGDGMQGADLGLSRKADDFTVGRMDAWFNVPAEAFYSDDYRNGSTGELAARGLFGEYALFFPAASLSRILSSGERSDGLILSKVEDVLLRFDYVSVAR